MGKGGRRDAWAGSLAKRRLFEIQVWGVGGPGQRQGEQGHMVWKGGLRGEGQKAHRRSKLRFIVGHAALEACLWLWLREWLPQWLVAALRVLFVAQIKDSVALLLAYIAFLLLM